MRKEKKQYKLTTKALLSAFLTVTLMTAGVPFAFAADSVTQADVDETKALIEAANNAEGEAQQAALPSGNYGIATNEALAAISGTVAADQLDKAMGIVTDAQPEIAAAATEAQNAAAEAEAARDVAVAEQAAAEAAAVDAEKAAAAAEGVKYAEAQLAADTAKEAAEEADKAAAEAYDAMVAAQAQAEAAKLAYEAAKEAYDNAVAQANAEAEAGLAEAAKAKAETQAACAAANKYYQEMLAAQARAEACAAAALKACEFANAQLKAETEKLARVILEQGANVAQKTAATAVTGAALAASKVAVAIAQDTVDAYEGNIADLEVYKAQLEAAISAAEQEIAALDAQIEGAEGDVSAAKAERDAALAALNEAKSIADRACEILAKKHAAVVSGVACAMKSYQCKVAAGVATDADVQALTELVLEGLGQYDCSKSFSNVTFIEGEDNIFTAEDKDGNVSYYQAKINTETGVLQYYPVETKSVQTQVENAWAMRDACQVADPCNTGYVAKEIFGCVTLNVVVKCGKYYVQTLCFGEQELQWDACKGFYVNLGWAGIRCITVFDTTGKEYIPSETPIAVDSNAITNIWAIASNPCGELDKRKADLCEKQAAYDEAQANLENIQAEIADLENQIDAKTAEIKAVDAEIACLQRQLAGSCYEQFVADLIAGNCGTEYGFTEAEIQALINIVNCCGDLSPRTKLIVLKEIEKLCQVAHDCATAQLGQAICDAEKAIAGQTAAVAQAAANAKSAQAWYLAAKAKECFAKMKACDAKNLKEKACAAARAAAAAYDAYKELVDKGFAPDDTDLKNAKDAWEAAEKAAKEAEEAYEAAEEAAESAAEDFVKAQDLANKAATKPYTVYVNHGIAKIVKVGEYTSKWDIPTALSDEDEAEGIVMEGSTIKAPMNSVIRLEADAPESGKVFSHWVVDSANVVLDDENSAVTSFIMPEEDVTVTAYYKDDPTPSPEPDPKPTPTPTPDDKSSSATTSPKTGDALPVVPFAVGTVVVVAIAGFALHMSRRRTE